MGDVTARHPTVVGNRLAIYLDAVVRELHVRGVITGPPQRTDPSRRLIGSIVVDCTQLHEAGTDQHPVDEQTPSDVPSPGGPVGPERPTPVNVTWDEVTGWSAGLHHDSTRSSRRYLHPDLLPPPGMVADFVVGLALGRPVGAAHPLRSPEARRAALRIVP